MIQRLRTLLFVVAAASLLANGAHAITGASAASERGGANPASIQYVQSGGEVVAVSFRMATGDKQVRIRLAANDGWHACSAQGGQVRCAVAPRPVTAVHRLEISAV